jgi:pimeloyl-ACP methyl ester carboxylesterase
VQATFEEADCAFEIPADRQVTCGYLQVPEVRDDATNQNVVRLHVAIFASKSANPAPDPLVYLEGGPGGDALEAVPYVFEERFAPFLAERDFIMFDQRGTGYSQPSLDCPEYKELSLDLLDQVLPPAEEERQFLDVMEACHERLVDEGIDLGAYDSAASAADLDDLRQALGYEQWNLLGISYGTRLALTTMRDYPQGLRSVVLDSTYPPQVNIVTETPANLERALDVFFAACAADEACNETYPNLRDVFFDLVDQVNAEPITVPVFHALNHQEYQARLAGDDLVGVLFQGLYSEEIIPLLPKFIYDTTAGEYDLLSSLLSNLIISDEFVSIGMNFSVQCQEEIPFATEEEAQAAAEAYPELESYFETSATSGETAFATCALWNVPQAPALENEAVSSDVPTVILSGELDPITPPAWGAQVHDNLPNSTYFTFPGLGHGVSVAGDCPRAVVMDFLADPSSPPDAACIAEMSGPAFVTPGSGPAVELVPFTTDLFGTQLSGVVPQGWEEVSTGIFARQQTALDQTALLQQAAPGIDPQQFLDLLTSQLGLDEHLAPVASQQAGGRTWDLYATDAQGVLVDIGLAQDEGQGITYVVLLFSHEAERDALYESVFLPALEAIQVDV